MLEKSHREDNALAERSPAQRDVELDATSDQLAINKKPSALFLARNSAREEAVGREGTRDPATELPYKAELQESLGVDLSNVKAHRGANASAAADKLGADAYAMRDENAIVFGDAAPSKDLVAHEVVHTLQQGGAGSIEQDEAEADAIGAKVAAGERVDAGAIKSGGGAVRKREKSNLKKIFDDYLKGVETSLDERYGPALPATEEEEGEKEIEAPDHAATIAGGTVLTGKGERTWGAGGFTDTETVTETRVKTPHEELVAEIDKARTECAVGIIGRTMKKVGHFSAKGRIQSELAALTNEGLDPELVSAKQQMMMMQVALIDDKIAAIDKEIESYKKLDAVLASERTAAADDSPAAIARRLATAQEQHQVVEQSTIKKTTNFDLLAGKYSKAEELETVEYDEAGTDTRTHKKETSYNVGGGKIGKTDSVSRSNKRKDSTTGSVSGTEHSTETSSHLIADDKGAYGFGKSKKLSGAIENSHGKATGGASLNGAVTTNIIEIPQSSDTKKFAVVTTVNVGLALEVGLDNKSEEEKKRVKASFKASGTAEAQLTQTRILEEAEVKAYLGELDSVANGKDPKSEKPELSALSKALAGSASLDNVLTGAAAVASSSDAAKMMGPDESIELTTKIGGEIGGSGGTKNAGIEGSAKGELFRTLKVGRVAGQGGKELIEITCIFGDSSEIHGAGTATALGVSATYGQKAWNKDQEAVTFRLDDSQPDYAYLYDEIVQTFSPASLRSLRTSKRFAQHVQEYSMQNTVGGETSWGFSGVIGVGGKSGSERGSERGMSGGEWTGAEDGKSTEGVDFKLGPLAALRRSETDGARFEVKDGVSVLDISESTDAAWLGKLDPSATDFVTEETPAKAAEKALLETYKKLDGFFLDPEDVEIIVQKAKHEPTAWNNVAFHADKNDNTEAADEWRNLRYRLKYPHFEEGVPIAIARDLAHGTAIADFMSKSDAKGKEYMEILLRGWARAGGADSTAGGTMYEFPEDVSSEKYKDVRRRVKGLPLHLATFVADQEKGLEPGNMYIAELQYDAAKLLKSIEDSYGFESERARIEMVGEIRELVATIPGAQRDFQQQCTGIVIEDADDALADHKMKARELEKTLETSKVSERWFIQRLKSRAEDYKHGERADQMKPLLENLEEMFKAHVVIAKQLRSVYRLAQIAEGEWRVSTSWKDDRRELDIDYTSFAEQFIVMRESVPLGLGTGSPLSAILNRMHDDYAMY